MNSQEKIEELARWNVGQSARMKRILADLEGKDSREIVRFVASFREFVAVQEEQCKKKVNRGVRST